MAIHDDIDLMLYLDGEELDDGARREVESQLEASADDRAKVESLGQVGETVRTYLELSADDADDALSGLWEGIERRLSSNGVTDSAVAAPVRSKTAAPNESMGLMAAVGKWFDNYRGYFMTSAATACAVVVVILVFRQPEEKVVTRTVYQPAPTEVVPVVAPTSTAAEVEELDVFGGSGAVLTIPGEDGEADTAVIWVTPDEFEVEGPI